MASTAGRTRCLPCNSRVSFVAILALLLQIVLLPGPALAALFPPNSAVLQLDHRNFPSKILQVEKPAIVAFTAPWCGHCQRLTPEFTRAAKNLEGIVHFGNVDCDEDKNKQLCAQYDVKGFPTILTFPATKRRIPKPYQGERAAKALVEYAVSSLPHSVKKLKAEEMAGWVRGISAPVSDGSVDGSTTKGINGKGKVLLLSNKATSSPLYKSLALDFRRTFDFAFARGDQTVVKSSAKNSLGINISKDEELPILVAFAPPAPSTAEGLGHFEKGRFETYEGKLKMEPLTDWLKGVQKKYGLEAGKSAGNEGAIKKQKSKSQAGTGPKKSPSHADTFDDPLPDGAFYEWRPPANDAKHRYSQQAEEIKAQYDALARKEKGERGDAEKMAFGEKHRVPKSDDQTPLEASHTGETTQDTATDDSDSASPPDPENPLEASSFLASAHTKSSQAPFASGYDTPPSEPSPAGSPIPSDEEEPLQAAEAADADAAGSPPSGRGYVYTDNQRADLHAINDILEEAGAYVLADKAAQAAGDIAEGVKHGARQVYENVRKAAQAVSGQQQEVLEDREEVSVDAAFDKKRKALLSAFTSWLQDEDPDWEESYSSDYLSATRDVEKLLREDPERARQMAEDSEVSMLGEFRIDLERMSGEGVLGEGKKKKLNELITLLEGRIAAREAGKRRDNWVEEMRAGGAQSVSEDGRGDEDKVAEAIRGLTGEDAHLGGVGKVKQPHDEL